MADMSQGVPPGSSAPPPTAAAGGATQPPASSVHAVPPLPGPFPPQVCGGMPPPPDHDAGPSLAAKRPKSKAKSKAKRKSAATSKKRAGAAGRQAAVMPPVAGGDMWNSAGVGPPAGAAEVVPPMSLAMGVPVPMGGVAMGGVPTGASQPIGEPSSSAYEAAGSPPAVAGGGLRMPMFLPSSPPAHPHLQFPSYRGPPPSFPPHMPPHRFPPPTLLRGRFPAAAMSYPPGPPPPYFFPPRAMVVDTRPAAPIAPPAANVKMEQAASSAVAGEQPADNKVSAAAAAAGGGEKPTLPDYNGGLSLPPPLNASERIRELHEALMKKDAEGSDSYLQALERLPGVIRLQKANELELLAYRLQVEANDEMARGKRLRILHTDTDNDERPEGRGAKRTIGERDR
ncbi:unnamed protein product [Vitrella brassicaformis CCMP3155]|uniref:Uncharacterized protein n=2 Tax=Vitrella brassicaformis TaxID=1169539 RepID=A0A0G4EHH9_VITBC|nr:unnamed protein product [Vitrella brassicaformis CCMP3155]|mmetsp:Transcript_8451/g.24053  ORF Transcript_8451/g.24053 Transcript_8451/m.24053 type:complete len:398 (+) Transcript_8451:136-1329(+)|eukprot:CEL95353.1 unnamed protein product [Vitrella brassicaformis CCMP3155]